MKIDPARTNPDVCETSLKLLRERCSEWFERRGEAAWLPDLDVAPPPMKSVKNVVLTGGFLKRLAESGNWPFAEMKLWTLSSAVKRVIVSEFGVRASAIGVIPRYELFPTPARGTRAFPKANEPFTFVFGGRISPTKNVEMLIRTYWHLQRHLKARLVLCGDFDSMAHPDWGRRETADYRAHLERVVKSLRWKQPPEFLKKTAPSEWLKGKFENPVFTSFSTFIQEDFGVALAQAQSAGWPAWLTAWGGHLECVRGDVRWIDPRLVAYSHEAPALIDLKARHLAASFERASANVEPLSETAYPEAVSAAEHLLYREGLEAFADSESGRKLFERHRRSFSAHPADHWAILTGDFHSGRKLSALESRCANILARAESEKVRVLFLSARDLRASDNAWTLAHATRIFLPYESEALRPFVNGLRRQLGNHIPLTEFHDRI